MTLSAQTPTLPSRGYPYRGDTGHIRNKISIDVLEIYRDKIMVSVKSHYPCEPRWYIFWRYEDKVTTDTVLVGEGFDTTG